MLCASDCRCSYAARFVDEYISATVGHDVLSIGEYWTDLAWAGSELEANQDAARQVRCAVLCYASGIPPCTRTSCLPG